MTSHCQAGTWPPGLSHKGAKYTEPEKAHRRAERTCVENSEAPLPFQGSGPPCPGSLSSVWGIMGKQRYSERRLDRREKVAQQLRPGHRNSQSTLGKGAGPEIQEREWCAPRDCSHPAGKEIQPQWLLSPCLSYSQAPLTLPVRHCACAGVSCLPHEHTPAVHSPLPSASRLLENQQMKVSQCRLQRSCPSPGQGHYWVGQIPCSRDTQAFGGGVSPLSTLPPSRGPPPTRRPNTTVAKKPPMKPSQVFFGDSCGQRAHTQPRVPHPSGFGERCLLVKDTSIIKPPFYWPHLDIPQMWYAYSLL